MQAISLLFDNINQQEGLPGMLGSSIGRKVKVIPVTDRTQVSRFLEVKEVVWKTTRLKNFLQETGIQTLESIYSHKFQKQSEEEILACLTGTSEEQKKAVAAQILKTLERYNTHCSISLEQQFCDLMFLNAVVKIKFDIFGKNDDIEIAQAIALTIIPRISIRGNNTIFSSVNDKVVKAISEEKADYYGKDPKITPYELAL